MERSNPAELEGLGGDEIRRGGARRKRGKLTALVREYLESDYEALERECDACQVDEAHRDADGYCSICKLRPLEAKFPLAFRQWIHELTRLYLWIKAGYPIDADELTYEGWQALAEITRFYEVKDIKALVGGAES